jgi:DNA-binding response OmpR family regulator
MPEFERICMSKHVLIVDDDSLITRSLAFSLQQAGYITSCAATAEEALNAVKNEALDAILLDIMLPGMDGLEALGVLQQETAAPIIFVTARRRELDEILGLELGADDYITKPFDTDVLLAHLKAVLRRSATPSEKRTALQLIQVGDLTIDSDARTVHVGKRVVELSPKEFDLLLTLAREAGRVLSVDDLLLRIWGTDWVGESQTIYVHVRWLREKIEENPAEPCRLVTVKGVGYKLIPLME